MAMISDPPTLAAQSVRPSEMLKLEPVTSVVGAEVTGLDLRKPLDSETSARLRTALLQHKVLFLRDQPIDTEQQLCLARRLGPLTPSHPIFNGRLPETPELSVMQLDRSWIAAIQAPGGITVDHPLTIPRRWRTRANWHTEFTFVANPAAFALVRGVEIPPNGGDTLFADLEALYESLSPALRSFLDTLQAIHVRAERKPVPRFDGRAPGPFASLHPLVSVHPETGKRALFLSGYIQAIHGLHPAESDALLDFLNGELSGRVEFQVRFRWTKDSVVIWDNRAVTHAGPIDAAHIQGDRVLHRATVAGELMRGPDGFVSRPLIGELFNAIS